MREDISRLFAAFVSDAPRANPTGTRPTVGFGDCITDLTRVRESAHIVDDIAEDSQIYSVWDTTPVLLSGWILFAALFFGFVEAPSTLPVCACVVRTPKPMLLKFSKNGRLFERFGKCGNRALLLFCSLPLFVQPLPFLAVLVPSISHRCFGLPRELV